MIKHAFWGWFGVALLVAGLGVLTMIGGLLGVPTIITLFTPTGLSTTPNVLQGLQIGLTLLGVAFLFAGVY